MKLYQTLCALVLTGAMGYGCATAPERGGPAKTKPPVASTVKESKHEETLLSASKVVISEYTVSMGKDYDVLVDDKKVATVEGKNVKIIGGDVFTLKTIDGKVIAYEQEHKRFLSLNRAASMYDGDGNLIGYFGEETISSLFSLSYVFHLYDKDKKEIGKSKKLGKSAIGKHDIYGNDGEVDYNIDKHWVMAGGDKYTLTVKDRESEISLWAAILMVCIEDAIGDANE